MTSAASSLFDHYRRQATLRAIRMALGACGALPSFGSQWLGETLGVLAGVALPLRWRLRRNLDLGLGPGNVPAGTVGRYFDHLGQWAAWSLDVYNRGFAQTGAAAKIALDGSVRLLDEAVARGRGVVLVSVHQFGHELAAAQVNRRHPVSILVRESKNPARVAIKKHWYDATGMVTVRRPRSSSLVADTMNFLRVLKRGEVLNITPDLIAAPEKGTAVRLFGRDIHLSPGVVVLAQRARSALVSMFLDWVAADRLLVRFTEPVEFSTAGDRHRIAADALQAWARQFEAAIRHAPESWMFWLDKQWTRALRSQPRKELAA